MMIHPSSVQTKIFEKAGDKCDYKKYPKPEVIAQMMSFLLSQPPLVEIRELLVHNRKFRQIFPIVKKCQYMPLGWKKKFNAVTKALKEFKEDWLPLDEMYWPSYAGSRRWYPGIKEEEARRRVSKQNKKQRERLAYLKRKQWIETKETAEGLFVRLTDQGKMECLSRTLHERPKLKGATVCLVLFDFPESVRYSRDAFRHFLKTSGFQLVQHSVWMSDRDVVVEILQFVGQTRIGKWVEVFVGEKKK